MKTDEVRHPIGTKFPTTKAVLVDGAIKREECKGVVTGYHDFYRRDNPDDERSLIVYHVDVDGLDQPFGENDITVALIS